jgi:dipeptidyl aminopeptidase/acylaminoacyl peptidase
MGGRTNVLELAQPLQNAGFNVLAFNYRGAWGSGGSYSLANRIEDVKAAMAFVKGAGGQFGVDSARLTVIGHSLGGLNALLQSADQSDTKCTVALAPVYLGAKMLSGAQAWTPSANAVGGLGGYSDRDLRLDILSNQPRLDVATRLDKLKQQPLLIVEAKRDAEVKAEDVGVYVSVAQSTGVAPFDHVTIDANHNFTLEGNRKELASTVVGWVSKHCR